MRGPGRVPDLARSHVPGVSQLTRMEKPGPSQHTKAKWRKKLSTQQNFDSRLAATDFPSCKG